MVNRIMSWLRGDKNYLKNLKAKLLLSGSVSVPRDLIRESEIYGEGFVYVLEIKPDGFIDISAHKKLHKVAPTIKLSR